MRPIGFLAVACAFSLWAESLSFAQYNETRRVSALASGAANGAASQGALSSSARFVVFASESNNLVASDNNSKSDIFLYDRADSSITLVSRGLSGNSANGRSFAPVISSDGTKIAFVSEASDLVNGDNNALADVFLYTVSSGQLTLVSVSTGGVQANAVSGSPAISSDGRYIAFSSAGSNLVASDNNSKADIFVRDTVNSTTELVSISSSSVAGDGDSSAPAISADGNIVAFVSKAANLVNNDTNASADIFFRNRSSGVTSRASVASDLTQADADSAEPALTADGTKIVFSSIATNLVNEDTNGLSDIFLYDTSNATTTRVSLSSNGLNSDGASSAPHISDNGRYILFSSDGTNLVNGDQNLASDAFVYDLSAASTKRISLSAYGAEATKSSNALALTGDGHYVLFSSNAPNLADSDANNASDVFEINVECLVDLGSTPSTDTDSDSTPDCQEVCGADALKTSPGTCGCGNSEVDSDSDGVKDCVDSCPSDINKYLSIGACGCGISDADTNGNGVPDCLDPTSATTPREAVIEVQGRKVTVFFPDGFRGVRYAFTLKKGRRTILSRRTRSFKAVINSLGRGVYKLTYTVSLGGSTTLSSPIARFRVK